MSGKATSPRLPGTIADVFEPLPQTAAPRPAEEPAEAGDVWEAARTYSRIDRGDSESLRLTRGFEPILAELNAGLPEDQQLVDPGLWLTLGGNIDSPVGQLERRPSRRESWDPRTWFRDRVTVTQQMETIFGEVRRRRAADPAFLPGVPDTWQEYRAQLLERDKRERSEAGQVLERATGFAGTAASFGGGAFEIMHDPVNVASLPLGGGGGAVKSIGVIALREALINGAIEAIQQPQVAENRELIGEELTMGEAAFNVGAATAFGGAMPFAVAGAGKAAGATGRVYDWTVGRVFAAMPDSVQTKWAARMTVGDMPIEDFYAGLTHREAAEFATDLIGADRLSPDEIAAIRGLEAEQLEGETSPFVPGMAGDTEHAQRLAVTLRNLIENRPVSASERALPVGGGEAARSFADLAPLARPPAEASTAAVRPQLPVARTVGQFAGDAIAAFKERVRRAESGGDDRAANARSSADGRYQFTDDTFATYYTRRFGGSRQAALKHKFDAGVQETLMDDLTRDNAQLLARGGQAVTPGNLYLVHFLGPKAVKVLQADPGAPIAQLLPPEFIRANPQVLGGGKSASEVIQWAHRKMGGDAAAIGARAGFAGGGAIVGEDPAIAMLREEALRLNEQAIGEQILSAGGTLPAMRSIRVDPALVRVDAERFQFKSGGDAEGVSDRLRGVSEWNPVYAGRVVLWQDEAGQIFVADGHQRLGLAKRIQGEHGGEIKLDGILMRSVDGVSAEDARTWAALKNIAEGTGSPVDAAKVIRQVGEEVLAHLPPRSALVRDGAALARLSDEAFGAVYNEVIAPDIAAVVGHLAADTPDAHAGLVNLLVKLDPANRGQAESVVRQALAAGFHKETQEELFGAREITSSLFLERAKVLERGLGELRKLKGAFGVAARNADALEGAGSKIARKRAEQEAKANGEAIEIIARVAFSKGPVADLLNHAAAELANGRALGDVVAEFVAGVRQLELADLARGGADDSGRLVPDGAGRGGDARGEGEQLPPEPSDQGQPSLLELEAATARFSDPDAAAPAQAESLLHDLKADVSRAQSDPAIVDRQRQELALKAGSPDRAAVEQDGTGGLGLFDAADQPELTFRLSDEGDEISAADLLAELEADDAAIAAIRGCL